MKETFATFGATNGLVGIVTMPEGGSQAPFACLLMNAGVIHRIGPHRLNVKIARALAADGIPSVRIDLSGLGDSEIARTDRDFWDQAVVDLQGAMDYIERAHGIHKFVVLGICSGAVNGYALTKVDKRVIGLMMFDGFAYPTWKTKVIRRWTRLRKLPFSTVLAGVRLMAKQHGRALLGHDNRLAGNSSVSYHPTKAEFAAAMEDFVSRGTAVFLAYSHTLEQHNFAGQLDHTYPGRDFVKRIRYEYVPEIDHAFTGVEAQRQFIVKVEDWVGTVARNLPDMTISTRPMQKKVAL